MEREGGGGRFWGEVEVGNEVGILKIATDSALLNLQDEANDVVYLTRPSPAWKDEGRKRTLQTTTTLHKCINLTAARLQPPRDKTRRRLSTIIIEFYSIRSLPFHFGV